MVNKLHSFHWTAVYHKEFVAYTEDSSDVVVKHDINQHAYADDNQLHASCFPRDVARARQHLSECTADLVVWYAQRRLQLNVNKTEVLLVGSKHNLTKLSNEDISFTIGLETVQPSNVVRDLGVWLDSELSLRHHVTKIAASCFYQLRRLRQVRRRAGHEVTTRLVLALVISKLDYCNSLLAGLPTSPLNVLQKVQNAAARLICQLRPRDNVSCSLQRLHWLSIRSHVLYRQCILMYRINCGQAPQQLIRR